MEWANDKIEFSKRDRKRFEFHPDHVCVIQTVRIWEDQEVSLATQSQHN